MGMLTGFISSKFEEYENCKGSRSWRRWKSVLLFPFFQAIFPARGIIRATRTRRGSINISKESGTKGKRWTDFVNGKYSWNSIGCVSVLGAARVKIKIKRRVFFERWRREISFSSVRTDKLIPNIYIYIYIYGVVGGGRFMRLSRRCLYGMTRYVGEKRSSGHKSLYRNFEFSVSMSMIDLGRSRQTRDRSAEGTSDGF